ncbi:MAG: M28 family peptidase [Clostridia bacterium]|nr:M28 family peptidase [Clostridia bacterium]MCR4577124.1 Zn-dependent exopeptidase M28 [Clostridiales bacterium]
MKDYLNDIDSRFPIRNSEAQKQAFREYALGEAKLSGRSAATVQESGGHNNVVIGDPESAKTVFTAHYDTPRRGLLPNLMLPTNRVLQYVYIFGIIFVMLAAAILAGIAVRKLTGLEGTEGRSVYLAVYALVYFGLFVLLFHGPANTRNRNDNTSGTAAVLTLAAKLSGDPSAAFILFDNEERGKKGSKAFAAAHADIKANTLIVNLDCVGNGDTFIAGASDAAIGDPRFPALKAALENKGGKVFPAAKANMNSDHKSFDKSVGIAACLYKKGVGYYTPRIHTKRDTVASPENIEKLTDALREFVEV